MEGRVKKGMIWIAIREDSRREERSRKMKGKQHRCIKLFTCLIWIRWLWWKRGLTPYNSLTQNKEREHSKTLIVDKMLGRL
jgi:hypothetical protein